MNYATKHIRTQVVFWLIWGVACLVFLAYPEVSWGKGQLGPERPGIEGSISSAGGEGTIFWQPRQRLRKWAWRHYCQMRRAHEQAIWMARIAEMGLCGALPMMRVVEWMTKAQFHRKLGALPVLYGLLKKLEVREIVNRVCETGSKVDHGAVVLVLVLNRLILPLPLYRISEWVERTVLAQVLGIAGGKFNDDRLGRTLTELAGECETVWQQVIQTALVKAKVKIDDIYHDLTAYITYGVHADSQLVDFGFAHNTPMKLRKFKGELNVSRDGHLPVHYKLWPGRTADSVTVEGNMQELEKLVKLAGQDSGDLLFIGDRANLSDQLVFAYQDHHVRYLSGLRVLKKVHKEILLRIPEKQFYADETCLLVGQKGPHGYWGKLCSVPFEYQGRQLTQRGLLVISGPMRNALRQTRAKQLKELRQQLHKLVEESKDKPRLKSPKAVQRRADQIIKASPVGKLISANATPNPQGQVELHWHINRLELFNTMQMDGRYLLVTNDYSLSPQQMFSRYHHKDGVEKCFHVTKHDLKVSPIYLHKDDRITSMMLINMLALLTYRLLERQSRQHGLALTTRQIISKLESFAVIETRFHDGSCLYRLVPIDPQQQQILMILADVLADLPWFASAFVNLPTSTDLAVRFSPPRPLPLLPA